MRHVRPGRKNSTALFAALSLLSLPSCFFSRGGDVVKTDPTVEEAHVFADTFQVSPTVAKVTPPPPPPALPAPREREVQPEPLKAAPPEVSVGLSDEEREKLRREAGLEIAVADNLINSLRGKALSPEGNEILLTAKELLQNSRSAYERGDFSGAIGLARKARLLAAGLSTTGGR
jgi:hypothetical protein